MELFKKPLSAAQEREYLEAMKGGCEEAKRLLVEHNMKLVVDFCDSVVVMKEGRVVEQGTVDELYDHPQAEYTKQLLKAAE